MKTIDRYIIKKYLGSFFFTMLLISMVAVVIDFSEKVAKFIDAELPVSQIISQYYIHFIPWINGRLWPLFALISVIFFTSRMAKNSEIIAALSGGISFYRLLIPYLAAGLMIALLLWIGKNYVIPKSCKVKNTFESTYLSKHLNKTLNNDIHMFLSENEKMFLRFYRKKDTTGQSFRLERFKDGELVAYTKANRILFKKEPNVWTLKDYEQRELSGMNEFYLSGQGASLDTVLDLTPEDFVRNTKLMETMTSRDLRDFIDREQQRGLNAAKNYRVEFHQRNADPFSIIILTIIGMAVASRKVRGGMGLHLAVGVVIGATFVIVSQFSATFSNNLSMTPALGAWIPNAIFTVIAAILLYFSQK